jgi:hypothetical protein
MQSLLVGVVVGLLAGLVIGIIKDHSQLFMQVGGLGGLLGGGLWECARICWRKWRARNAPKHQNH